MPPQPHRTFDTWNSSSTGHQRAENPYSATTAWKQTRSQKLAHQFRTGDCLPAQANVSLAFDGTCGPRSPSPRAGVKASVAGPGPGSGSGPGEWKWVSDEEAKRSAMGVRDIRSFMSVGKRKAGGQGGGEVKRVCDGPTAALASAPAASSRSRSISASTSTSTSGSASVSTYKASDTTLAPDPEQPPNTATTTTKTAAKSTNSTPELIPTPKPRPIFAGTTIYINGSTLPLISDHKLKHLLVAHGAHVSISMARKTVSHVVVGQPNVSATGTGSGSGRALGAGGGLAARKLQQEIMRGGWKGVKIVGVEWVLESIQAGKRLAESRFGVVSVAGKGQGSVADMFRRD